MIGSSSLVVGGAGFVGSNLVRALLDRQAERVHVVDNLLSSERSNLPNDGRVTFREGSIAAEDVLSSLDEDGYDYLFHLATYHGNQSSIHDPLADHENNLLTTLRLLEHIKGWKGRLKKFVYSGAGCAVAKKTFAETEGTMEDAPISIEMDSPYSISKIVGEFYSVYYHRQHGVPTVRARFQNVYGPGEVLGAGRWRGTPATVWRNVTPTFIYKALRGEPLPVEGGGVASRDFIYVDDIVEGLICCAVRGMAGEVYNLASGRETTIAEMAGIINELTGNAGGIRQLPQRTWDHSGRRFGSTGKARAELGFAAKIGIREGLERTVAWTRSNRDRIEQCIAKHAHHLNED